MTDVTWQQQGEPDTSDEGRIKSARDRYRDWPTKGGSDPQPWDLKALELPRPGQDRAALDGGEPDTISPVQLRAGLPLLTYGSQGDDVRDLGRRLGELGYPNSVSRGSIDNAYGVYDESIAQAVAAFRRDYNVAEDPSQFPRDPAGSAESHAGPWTLEAILRASDRQREERA